MRRDEPVEPADSRVPSTGRRRDLRVPWRRIAGATERERRAGTRGTTPCRRRAATFAAAALAAGLAGCAVAAPPPPAPPSDPPAETPVARVRAPLPPKSGVVNLDDWLAAAQCDDGSWDTTETFPGRDPASGSSLRFRMQGTSYATLALAELNLWGGPAREPLHERELRAAAHWLCAGQSEAGEFLAAPTDDARSVHALAALSLAETSRALRSEEWRRNLERAAARLTSRPDPWPDDDDLCGCDPCTLLRGCLTVLAVHASERAGLPDARSSLPIVVHRVRGALGELLADPVRHPVIPRMCGAGTTDRLGVAAGVLALQVAGDAGDAGDAADGPLVAAGSGLLASDLPRWSPDHGKVDFRYWLFGTFAMERVEGTLWRDWSGRAQEVSLHYRSPDRPAPYRLEDAWSRIVGPVGPVAAMALVDQCRCGFHAPEGIAPYRFLGP